MTRSVFSEKYRRLCGALIEARKARGLTQIEVARRLGRPQSFVAKYEQGERRLDVVEFLEVADALRVSAKAILAKIQGTNQEKAR